MRYTALKTRYLSLLTLTYLEHSHSHSHLNIQTPNPHTIGGRKPVGVRRLSSTATSQLSHCLKRLKRGRGRENGGCWRSDGHGLSVGWLSSSSSSSPFLRPNCLAGFAGDCRRGLSKRARPRFEPVDGEKVSLSLSVILFFFLPIIYGNLYSCLGLNCRLVLCCSGFSLRYAPDFLYYALFYMCIVTESWAL